MLRRNPATILVAHKMDPGRREIYVEGERDRAFLNWLADDGKPVTAKVIPIDLVDIPEVEEGGNRERLRLFLTNVLSAGYEIRGLLDADQSTLIGEIMRFMQNPRNPAQAADSRKSLEEIGDTPY